MVLKKIYIELVEIKKRLQAIQDYLESNGDSETKSQTELRGLSRQGVEEAFAALFHQKSGESTPSFPKDPE